MAVSLLAPLKVIIKHLSERQIRIGAAAWPVVCKNLRHLTESHMLENLGAGRKENYGQPIGQHC